MAISNIILPWKILLKDANIHFYHDNLLSNLHKYANNTLDIGSRGGILIENGQERWCTDRTQAGDIWYSDW